MDAELPATAAEVGEPRPRLHRGRHALDRQAHALRADGEPDVGVVGRLDPFVGVAVEVVLHIVLHEAKLASPR